MIVLFSKRKISVKFFAGSLLHEVIKWWRHISASVLRIQTSLRNWKMVDYYSVIVLYNSVVYLKRYASSFRTSWSTHVPKIYLYVPVTLDEYHAWLHMYGLRRALKNGKQSKEMKIKIYVSTGYRTQRPLAFQPGAWDQSATLTVVEMSFETLAYFYHIK